jgi:putative flippase GtrA
MEDAILFETQTTRLWSLAAKCPVGFSVSSARLSAQVQAFMCRYLANKTYVWRKKRKKEIARIRFDRMTSGL